MYPLLLITFVTAKCIAVPPLCGHSNGSHPVRTAHTAGSAFWRSGAAGRAWPPNPQGRCPSAADPLSSSMPVPLRLPPAVAAALLLLLLCAAPAAGQALDLDLALEAEVAGERDGMPHGWPRRPAKADPAAEEEAAGEGGNAAGREGPAGFADAVLRAAGDPRGDGSVRPPWAGGGGVEWGGWSPGWDRSRGARPRRRPTPRC